MLSWDLYFTPGRTSLIDKNFDKEYDKIILKSPFSSKTFDIDVEFDVHLERLFMPSLVEEQGVKTTSQDVVDEDEHSEQSLQEEFENEELPYDEATSTELLISKWNACPVPGRVYFYHRWDDRVDEEEDAYQDALVRVHLHRVKCKASALVKAMQETRRMALPRNFRKIYFGGSRGKGKSSKKGRPSSANLIDNKL